MNKEDMIQKLGNDIIDLTEEYSQSLPAYEIGHQLIALGVDLMLSQAPHPVIAFKTILACVENGITRYELHKELYNLKRAAIKKRGLIIRLF